MKKKTLLVLAVCMGDWLLLQLRKSLDMELWVAIT